MQPSSGCRTRRQQVSVSVNHAPTRTLAPPLLAVAQEPAGDDEQQTPASGDTLQRGPEEPAPPSSELWQAVERLRPLPTADGQDLIRLAPSPEECRAIEALWRAFGGKVVS
jgi:hypothetical protein